MAHYYWPIAWRSFMVGCFFVLVYANAEMHQTWLVMMWTTLICIWSANVMALIMKE